MLNELMKISAAELETKLEEKGYCVHEYELPEMVEGIQLMARVYRNTYTLDQYIKDTLEENPLLLFEL